MPSMKPAGRQGRQAAALIARRACAVKIPAMAVPSGRPSAHWAASVSGVKASAPLTSADQASV